MRTLFDKLWSQHRIVDDGPDADLLAVDRIFLHERTGGVALKSLLEAGYSVHAPDRVYAVMDHIVSFREGRGRNEARFPGGDVFITETRLQARDAGIHLIDTDDSRQGIIHVIAPELGLVQPGYSVICPDSHTCSLGALGTLSIGVGSSDVEHAMATGAIRLKRPPQMRIRIEGAISPRVFSKDIALYIIAHNGADGASGYAIEYCGSAIEEMEVEARLTLCNLAVEFAAFTAVIAPDLKVQNYLYGRPQTPTGDAYKQMLASVKNLNTDQNAKFDKELCIDGDAVSPMVTWGTSPAHAVEVDGRVPGEVTVLADKEAIKKACEYMGISPGMPLRDLKLDGAFIGSCTNGRLSDLREAAHILKGRRIAEHLRAVCVPGSQQVKRQAEAEGLDQIFKSAGFEWGSPGCAMCFYAGGETFPPRARVISSTNRNFQGRQGPGVRTHLASPATVAASAITGRITAASEIEELSGAA